jgi:UDP-glucuronate 4-epimerase
MAGSYSHIYGINTVGLRFFTVYGPWGRPDMAPMLFTKAILAREPIKVFNSGNLFRDFTYIGDIVEGIQRILEKPVEESGSRVFNIGRGEKVALGDFIRTLSEELGVQPVMDFTGMQPGDVHSTHADTSALYLHTGYSPTVSLKEGIREFVLWYKGYYS